ncbi:MAG: methylamine utilization protein [Nitrospirae bacterium]|nr:methylamine utilization protein [Nitrospirota bacterium]
MMTKIAIYIIVLLCLCSPGIGYCYDLVSEIKDAEGALLENAVITATPLSGEFKKPDKNLTVEIDQIDKTFVDFVTPIMVGTTLVFPNSDKIRHQVYSFSEAKKFEIPLYPPGQGRATPVTFDKPGVVVLGCNIHDWMKAYVYVVETPFFAKTGKNGKATIKDIPPGQYKIEVWHPYIKKSSATVKQPVNIGKEGDMKVDFVIDVKKALTVRRAPGSIGGGVYP